MFKKTAIVDWAKQKGISEAYLKLSKTPKGMLLDKYKKEFGTTYEEIRDKYLEEVSNCPQCNNKMAAMGYDFRPPKSSSIEEWKIIEILYNNGFAFIGCGCDVGYTPPKLIRDLPNFFKQHERLSEGEKLLEKIQIKFA
jgi:hypothetical protein